jgi:hypothetical protein
MDRMDDVMSTQATSSPGAGRIGRDLWPAGRLIRLLAGALLLVSILIGVLSGELGTTSWKAIGELAIAGVGIAILYTAAVALLGDRLLARLDPWLAAIVLVGPPAVLYFVPSTPGWVILGFFLYVGISLMVQAGLNYGGCEVAAFPVLVLRRRYTVYCALNGVDVAERAVRGRSRLAAAVLAVVVFLLVTAAQVAIEQAGGRSSAFLPAYVAFLVVGYVVSRIRRASARRTRR